MISPKKKKIKLVSEASSSKRSNEVEEIRKKRIKTDNSEKEVDLQALKRKNFITACEQVSCKSYLDYHKRLKLVYLPRCLDGTSCKHIDYKNGTNIKEMPSYAEESFKIEMKANMWFDALEVCIMCITPVQYLSSNVLKDIVEIILNAHEDLSADYTVEYLINKCQLVLTQNFSTHPPCIMKGIRKCYNTFLSAPMDVKENTFSNRSQFGYDKGIIKYCMNRLEFEISSQSKNGGLVDRTENIPDEMKQSVKGLHWQKKNFEIYELLTRPERIERLMAVLESVIELLQFDLAIWHSRYTNNLGCHIMRSHKPLMAYLLWSNNVLYTGAVNNNCRQIFRLFVYLIYLQYPDKYIKIMTTWLNTVIQTFYICETNSSSNYPNTGKYCTAFANEFYKILSELPHSSVIKVLEHIQPTYMRHLVGNKHIQTILSMQEDVIENFTIYIKNMQWKGLPISCDDMKIEHFKQKKNKNLINYLTRKCESWRPKHSKGISDIERLPTIDLEILAEANNKSIVDQNHVILCFYITLEAYLDAYNVQDVQETLNKLNEQLLQKVKSEDQTSPVFSSYSVTEQFIKKYRSLYQSLKELVLILHEIRSKGQFPAAMRVFENIGLLGLECVP